MDLQKRLSEIEQRLERATPFDWYESNWWKDATKQLCIDGWPSVVVPLNCMVRKEKEKSLADTDDLRLLLALVKEYRAALEIMEQVAPKYHADGCRCIQEDASDKYCNCGCKTAREALRRGEEMG